MCYFLLHGKGVSHARVWAGAVLGEYLQDAQCCGETIVFCKLEEECNYSWKCKIFLLTNEGLLFLVTAETIASWKERVWVSISIPEQIP